jgi:hypothetical protein
VPLGLSFIEAPVPIEDYRKAMIEAQKDEPISHQKISVPF